MTRAARPPIWWPARANVSRVAVSRAFNPHTSHQARKARPDPAGSRRSSTTRPTWRPASLVTRPLAPGRRHRARCLQPLGKPGDRRADHGAAERGLRHAAVQDAHRLQHGRDAADLHEGLQSGLGHRLHRERPADRRSAACSIAPCRSTSHYPASRTRPTPREAGAAASTGSNVIQRDGIEQAVALLQGYGARRIAYLVGRGQVAGQCVERRADAAQRSWPSAGCRRRSIIAGRLHLRHGLCRDRRPVPRRRAGPMRSLPPTTSVPSACSMRCATSSGCACREDVKVVGFDDIAQSHWKSYNLTTVKIRPRGARARAGAADPQAPQQPRSRQRSSETMQTRLVVRGTVG